ncbi:tyrosine-type recombinase/integrase [Parvibaculum sedimenti]|uniref:Tyrosine-type recombinase/integrase n=1 Tax=Parvibaculum sedimenti TaxID=2608632 RepID=A0A6N6VCX9_9HYPH|nr:tyrosine-type recombinase/integrase [Parvibaculum sedimenti]KAB7738420.1 tyrosine-type recombinase/integrase [Parvibaculum sedimenti]
MVVRKRLTLEVVKRLKPGETFWDSDVSGFGARCQGEAKTYFLKYRVGGRQRWLSIGRHGSPWTPETARKEAIRILSQVVDGKDPAANKQAARKAPTVKEFGQRFLEEHAEAKRKPRTAEFYRDILERIVYPKMGTKRIRDVTRADVAKLHTGLATKPYLANRVVAVLSKMFNAAEAWGERQDGSNPCRHVEKFKETARERFLSAKELAALGDALRTFEGRWVEGARLEAEIAVATHHNDAIRLKALRLELENVGRIVTPWTIAALRLLIFTGARLSEILTLEWAWVDIEKGVARLPDSKTGAKTLQLPPPAIEALNAVPRVEGNPHVIVGAKAGAHMVNLQKPWREIRTLANLPDVRIHDLRHAFASVAASSGMALPIIGKMLGHSQPQTTARYAHLANDPVKVAAATVAAHIASSMAKKM